MSTEVPKLFVVDSSVFTHDPNAIFAFEQNIVVIPGQVFSDLSAASKVAGERGANARQAMNTLWAIISRGKNDFKAADEQSSPEILLAKSGVNASVMQNLKSAVCCPIPTTGGVLALYEPAIPFPSEAILSTVSSLDAILVTKDTSQRLIACARRLKAEDYRHDRIIDDDRFYSGRSIIYLPGELIAQLANEKSIQIPHCEAIYYTDFESDKSCPAEKARSAGYRLSENEFIVIRNSSDPTRTFLARYSGGRLYTLQYASNRPFDVNPRNVGQRFALEALMAPCDVAPLVILKGQAGTAKTFLSLACGLQQA